MSDNGKFRDALANERARSSMYLVSFGEIGRRWRPGRVTFSGYMSVRDACSRNTNDSTKCDGSFVRHAL